MKLFSVSMNPGLQRNHRPRLSVARTTPSLNLTPMTDVPVTAGDCVCVFGIDVCIYDWS